VHFKSQVAQQNRTLLAGCKVLQSHYIDIEMVLRGLLRGYGLKVGLAKPMTVEVRVRELAAYVPGLGETIDALLGARATLVE
jgi:hypothetical protein